MNEIKIEKIIQSKLKETDFDNIPFGRVFGDHMFRMDYINGEWKNATICPFGNISISPTLSSLHYGQAIFEGMKAHKGQNGEILLFRPEENAQRLNRSAQRMCMPTLPEEMFLKAIKTLVKIDEDWIPSAKGSALYLRPFMFASDEYLGVKPSQKYIFMIYSCPVNQYYTEPLKIKIETKYSRAVEGGVGYAKAAGNYAASMFPASLAQEKGYHQLLWTDAKTHSKIEELGTSNFFAVFDDTIVTPSLSDTILDGITRKSIIELSQKLGYKIQERDLMVQEIIDGYNNGTLKETFACGTAATITQIATIHYLGIDMGFDVNSFKISSEINTYLNKIKYGLVEDNLGWIVSV